MPLNGLFGIKVPSWKLDREILVSTIISRFSVNVLFRIQFDLIKFLESCAVIL